MANAAWWTGRLDESIGYHERAYAAHLDVWLAEGDPDVALESIRAPLVTARDRRLRGLGCCPGRRRSRWRRTRSEMRASAAAELAEIAAATGTTGLLAAAAYATAASVLVAGDGAAAAGQAREADRRWQELDAPYEAARARELLGLGCRAAGDESSALVELQAAKSSLDRLGAAVDLRRLAAAIGAEPSPGERVRRAFLFTDIVRSTNLIDAIGDEAWEHVVRWHDSALREECRPGAR